MVRRALIGLTALVGVASAQPVPNATWTLSSPRTAPTVEWSPDGRYVALSSDSSVEVLDGTTFKVVWSRTVSGALPSFLSMYAHPDRAHFAINSQTIWVRTASGGTYTEFNVKTGAVVRTHTFSDWSGDYVLSPQSGILVAVKLSVAGSTETIDIRAYDSTTLALVNSRSASHAYVAGVDFPVGRYTNKTYVGFYGKLLNPRTTAFLTWDSGTTENWNVAFDPDFGVVQTVVNNSIVGGSQHVNAAGSVDWTAPSMPVVTGLQFAKTDTSNLGVNPTGSTVQVFDYATGAALYESSVLSGTAFSFGAGCLNVKDGRFVINSGTAGHKACDVYKADAAATSYQSMSFPISGVATMEPIAGGVLASGNANFMGMLTNSGSFAWSGMGNTAPVAFAASKTGAYAAAVMATEIDVVNSADGSPFATYAGSYTKALWISDTQLLAVKADGSADRLDVAAGSIVLHDTLPVAFQAGGTVTDNGKYAIGYANGNMHVYNLTTSHDTTTAYPQFVAGWESFFKTALLSNGRVGLLEKSGTDLKWSLYDIVANKLVLNSSLSYPSPSGTWPSLTSRGALSKNVTAPVAAFFGSNVGVGTDGAATSQLKIARFSDGKVLSTIDNVFTAVNAMAFSADGSALYVATGGTADNGAQDLVSLPVPTWLSTLTITPGTVTGGTAQVKIKLAGVSPANGVRVQLSVNGSGATIPALRTIPGGASLGIVTLTLPAVTTDTTFTVSANIEGDSDTLTASVVDLTPVPASIVPSKASFYHSQAESLTVTLTGNAPTGGTVVNLSSNNANLKVPATVTIPAGSKTGSVDVTSIASSVREDGTFTATVGTTSVNCTATALANTVSVLSFSPSSVMAGNGSTGTVGINGVAGPGGVTVGLSSSLAGTSVPATVSIAEGANTATFAVTTLTSGSASSPAITGTYGSATKTTNLTVTQTTLSSLTLSPSSLPAGNSSTATLTIGTTATTGGLTVGLTYTGTGVSGPASVTVAAGATTATYTVTTTSALTGQAATTTATLGASTKTANLTITPTQVTAFTLNAPSLTGGTNSTGTITISAPAPAGGLVVTLTNDKTALITVPASITVAAGATSFNFSWATTPTLASQTANLTAKISGIGQSVAQTVVPPKVTGISFTPNTVAGGAGSSFTVTLDGPAPAGYSISLANGNTARMTITSINPMKTVTGATSASGTVTTTTGAATTASLTATGIGGGSASATLTIN